jgi:hypothetical protein
VERFVTPESAIVVPHVLGKFRDLNRSAGGELTEVNRHAFGAELIQINGEVSRENET